jgi:hypothetical protein
VQFNGSSQAEAIQFSAANQVKARARSSAAAAKKVHLLCRGAVAETAKVVQFSAASLAKAGARSSAAAAAATGRAGTAVTAVVHHGEDKFTGLNS